VPTLTVDGATVAYSDTGVPDGRPDAQTVVFGHGLLFSGWMFAAQIEALRSEYRCVAIDWRGQGQSHSSSNSARPCTTSACRWAVSSGSASRPGVRSCFDR
jgi:3-oxoadipate enol-lactonase